jgi:hypothetical protein
VTETEFIDAVAGWHDFHAATAGISATLIGLLFVGLAMNPAVMQDDGPTGMRTWAGLTFHNFLIVLAIALVVLIPDQSAEGLALPIGLMSAHGVYRVVLDIITVARTPDPDWHWLSALSRFGFALVAYLLGLWSAWLAWQQDIDSMYVLVWVIFLLVMSASSSCWDLLKAIGTQTTSG